jgi:steroid 5-alpha reductase family enzyme
MRPPPAALRIVPLHGKGSGGGVSEKSSGLRRVLWAYTVCLTLGAAALLVPSWSAPWNALVADVAATLVIFGFSRAHRNSSFYDPYWSVIPPLLAVFWFMVDAPTDVSTGRAILVIVLVWAWGARLTANWATFWGGLRHEDWRYPLVREKAGPRGAIWVDLFGIHLFPTIQVFLGCLPIFAVMTRGSAPLGALDLLAAVVTLGAIAIETVADLQLHAFIGKRRGGKFMRTGLWAWSRHPNYFGELSFWWGLMLFGLAAAPQAWRWIVPGAIAMTAMFWFASIPLMDRRSVARRPGYAEYMREVSALVPLPPRRQTAVK